MAFVQKMSQEQAKSWWKKYRRALRNGMEKIEGKFRCRECGHINESMRDVETDLSLHPESCDWAQRMIAWRNTDGVPFIPE